MRFSVVLPDFLALSSGNDEQNRTLLRQVANDPAFEELEVFLPPAVLADASALREAAESTLQLKNFVPGRVSFHAIHHLPEIWADGAPRILRSLSLSSMARDRYLRDRFAVGPIALSVAARTMPTHRDWTSLQAVLEAEPVSYDSIQCTSQALARAISIGPNGPNFRLDVISECVDCEQMRPPSSDERSPARQALRIPEDATVAMYHSPVGPFGVGDLYPVVQAFAQCAGPNDWLVVGGDPTSNDSYVRLKGWLNDAGLAGRARLLGYCPPDKLLQRLWAADLFLMPRDNANQPVGVAVLEAMSAGLPVIASDWAGLNELVRDGENGYLIHTCWVPGSARIAGLSPFSPERTEDLLLSQCIVIDQESLADRLGSLLHDAQVRAKLSRVATATAQEHDSAAILKQCLELFREQLREASKETAEDRARRKLNAGQLALPTPYDSILCQQGTRPLDPTDILELTDFGHRLLRGEALLPTYPEISVLARKDIEQAVIDLLGEGPKSSSAVQESLGANKFEDTRYMIAMLLKRGAIRLSPR